MNSFNQDLRYSLRTLARHPGIVVAAVLSLTIGIGVNTAIFSVLNALLRPVPVRDQDRTVVVFHAGPANPDRGTSFPAYVHYRGRTDLFADVMGFTGARPLMLVDGEQREQVYAALVTASFFSMTEINVWLGRPFDRSVDESAAPHLVAVLSHAFWQRRFGSDPAVVGKTLIVNDRPFTITGVAAAGFSGLDPEASVDLWIPIATWAHVMGETGRLIGDEHWMTTVARLQDGVTFAGAQAALAAADRVLPRPADEQTRIRPISQLRRVGSMGDVVFAGLGALVVGLLELAVACTNVTNLLLARAAARQAEMSIRLALGASRARLMRLWMTESFLLCVTAGVLSFLFAAWLMDVVVAFKPPTLVGSEQGPTLPLDFQLDIRIFAFTLGLSVVTALSVGLVAALQGTRPQRLRAIRPGGVTDRRFAPGLNVPSAVIALQMVLSVLLLIPCGLFVRSWWQGASIDPGFEAAQVLLLPVSSRQPGVNVQKPDGFDQELADRVALRPGVAAVTLMDPVPLWFGGNSAYFEAVNGRTSGQRHRIGFSRVAPNYFDVLRIPLVRGRDFTRTDTTASPPVAIVNETMARMLWPEGEAVGQRVRQGESLIEIVGVARDVKYRHLGETSTPFLYVPLAQDPTDNPTLSLAVRATGDPKTLQAAIAQDVRALIPNWPSFQFRTLDEGLALQRQLPRLAATLLGGLGGAGLFLAMVGVYGLMAYLVKQRRHEIGIHLALGAPVRSILALVIRQGMTVCIAGVTIGLVMTLAAARVIGSVLYGIRGADPLTYVVVPAVLLGVALLACYLPARQATKVHPVEALRAE
jgi:macrolide transport system ATP-binding/permease protein